MALFLKRKDYKSAIILALELDQPYRILTILNQLLQNKEDESVTGSRQVDEYFKNLGQKELERFLNYLRDWNTHSKHVFVAQTILYLIVRNTKPQDIQKLANAKELMESLVVYSERHLETTNQMIKENYLLEYTLERMNSLF